MNLSPHLFWDTDPKKVDYEKHARWLIERVFSRGMMSDVREIQKFYGNTRIVEEMIQARTMERRTLNFLSLVYQIPLEKFRCYKERQSNPGHLPY